MADAARTLYPERGRNNPEVIDFAGRFALSTSPAIIAGRSYSIGYTATGIFTVTTLFQWAGLVGGGLYVMSSTLTDFAQLVSFSVANRQLVFQFQSAGAANAGTTAKEIGFKFDLQQKNIPFK